MVFGRKKKNTVKIVTPPQESVSRMHTPRSPSSVSKASPRSILSSKSSKSVSSARASKRFFGWGKGATTNVHPPAAKIFDAVYSKDDTPLPVMILPQGTVFSLNTHKSRLTAPASTPKAEASKWTATEAAMLDRRHLVALERKVEFGDATGEESKMQPSESAVGWMSTPRSVKAKKSESKGPALTPRTAAAPAVGYFWQPSPEVYSVEENEDRGEYFTASAKPANEIAKHSPHLLTIRPKVTQGSRRLYFLSSVPASRPRTGVGAYAGLLSAPKTSSRNIAMEANFWENDDDENDIDALLAVPVHGFVHSTSRARRVVVVDDDDDDPRPVSRDSMRSTTESVASSVASKTSKRMLMPSDSLDDLPGGNPLGRLSRKKVELPKTSSSTPSS